MKQKPSIGVIGAGMVADFHMDAILKTRRANILWLADVNKKTLLIKRKKYNVPNGTADYRDLLRDDRVDAVIITSPPFTHLPIAIDAMRAGKHVLLEKPMVINRPELNRLVKEVKKHKHLLFMECSSRHTRLQPKFHFIKKLIDNGDIGKVYHIHHNHLMRLTFIEYNPKGAWSLKKTLAGAGAVLDWGPYDLAFHLGLLNDVPELKHIESFAKTGVKVYRNHKIKSNVEDHSVAFMRFDTGLTYYYERGAGVHSDIANETRIFGTRGSLRFSFYTWDSPQIEHYWVNKNRVEKKTIRKVNMSKHPGDHPALINHFFDCLASRAKPVVPLSLAQKHYDILFRILYE